MMLRPNDYDRISCMMLLRLAARDMDSAQRKVFVDKARGAWKDPVPWGSAKTAVDDVLKIVNLKRQRDGRPLMDNAELLCSLRTYLDGKRKDPLSEELSDALCCLREERLGISRFPLVDRLKHTG